MLHHVTPGRRLDIGLVVGRMHAVAKSGLAGQQLSPRGDTERIGTGGPCERRTLADELVEVGRLDDGIAQRMDRVRPLIVGDQEEDVGLVGGRHLCSQQRQNKKGEQSTEKLHSAVFSSAGFSAIRAIRRWPSK